jgi:hypothetical protein
MDWTLVFEVYSNFVFDELQSPFQRLDFIFCANKCLKLWVFHGLCQLIACFSLYHIFIKRGLFLNCFSIVSIWKDHHLVLWDDQNHVVCVWQGGFGYGDEDYMKIWLEVIEMPTFWDCAFCKVWIWKGFNTKSHNP